MSIQTLLQKNSKETSERINILLKGNENILQPMRYSALSGGKYIRSFLIREFARNLELPQTAALDIASAIEIAHTYSLIHDDLPAMDDASLRRNQKTCHLKFDEATAILAGDALLSFAFEIITNCTNIDPEIKLELVRELAVATGHRGMVEGQYLDIKSQNSKLELAELQKINYLKTGKIFRFCSIAPFILSSNLGLIAFAQDFALNFGLLFQIIDDILDETGKANETGKDYKKDAELNKVNYVSLIGLNESYREAEKHADKAISSLKKIPFNTDNIQELVKFNLLRKN